MSYILDALRKADAQRARDPSRGIHAQAQVGPVATAPRDWRQPAMVAAVTAVAVLAAVALWPRAVSVPVAGVSATSEAPRPSPSAMPAPALQAPVAASPGIAPQVVAPSAAPAAPARSVQPAPPPALTPVPAAVARAPVAAPVPVSPARPERPARTASAVAAPGAATAQTTAPTNLGQAVAAAPTQASDRVMSVQELPFQLQRELPRLAISGGVYSENPAQRMLIVGGLLMNEGSEVAPGLVLEQIRPNAAVLKFRGYRYSVPF